MAIFDSDFKARLKRVAIGGGAVAAAFGVGHEVGRQKGIEQGQGAKSPIEGPKTPGSARRPVESEDVFRKDKIRVERY